MKFVIVALLLSGCVSNSPLDSMSLDEMHESCKKICEHTGQEYQLNEETDPPQCSCKPYF